MTLNDQIFPMKPSEFENSPSVESYDGKTAENYRNWYNAEKSVVFKQSRILTPNIGSTILILESRLCQNFKSPSLILSEK